MALALDLIGNVDTAPLVSLLVESSADVEEVKKNRALSRLRSHRLCSSRDAWRNTHDPGCLDGDAQGPAGVALLAQPGLSGIISTLLILIIFGVIVPGASTSVGMHPCQPAAVGMVALAARRRRRCRYVRR